MCILLKGLLAIPDDTEGGTMSLLWGGLPGCLSGEPAYTTTA